MFVTLGLEQTVIDYLNVKSPFAKNVIVQLANKLKQTLAELVPSGDPSSGALKMGVREALNVLKTLGIVEKSGTTSRSEFMLST